MNTYLGPVGGGNGYQKTINRSMATTVVSDRDGLLTSLNGARRGDIVYVEDSSVIDLTGFSEIPIPEGVTLASGRGNQGSSGAVLFSTDTHSIALLTIRGDAARITGLRIRGPFAGIGDDNSPSRDCIWSTGFNFIEVDNCQLFRWPQSCVFLNEGSLNGNHIHHNFIHHNSRHRRGYGVLLWGAHALIESNLFDHNRHSIAGRGIAGEGYEARYNIVLANATGHCFDVHGGADRGDGTDIAGDWIHIHQNIFYNASQTSVLIRGKPRIGCLIERNIFNKESMDLAVQQTHHFGNFIVQENILASGKIDSVARFMRL